MTKVLIKITRGEDSEHFIIINPSWILENNGQLIYDWDRDDGNLFSMIYPQIGINQIKILSEHYHKYHDEPRENSSELYARDVDYDKRLTYSTQCQSNMFSWFLDGLYELEDNFSGLDPFKHPIYDQDIGNGTKLTVIVIEK